MSQSPQSNAWRQDLPSERTGYFRDLWRRNLCEMDNPLDAWFAREILVHEGALTRYLTRAWPIRDEVHDLRQEIYVRVYEAAAKSPPRSAKSFLFAIARNLMTDLIRRGRVVSIESGGDWSVTNVLVDDLSPERRVSAHQELRRLAIVFDLLPRRCRQVVWLRRVDAMSQKEVASKLGITEKRVEKHIATAMRRLADSLFGEDVERQDKVHRTRDARKRS